MAEDVVSRRSPARNQELVLRNWPLSRFIIGLAIFAVSPYLLGWEFSFSIGAEVAIFAFALMGLNIVYGWTGQISLAHFGFLGLGAYTTAILRPWTGALPFGFGYELLGVISVAVVAGLVVGLPAVRLSGLQLAILTLAFAEVFQWALNHFPGVSGGSQGIVVGALEIGPFTTLDSQFRFFLALGFVAVGGAFMLSLQKTPIARAMFAVRDSELAARSVGVNLSTVKLIAFVLGSIYAAVAGWLFAYHAFAVTPGHFTMFANVFMLLGIVVGGRYSILGAFIGAIYLVVIPELVRSVGSGNLYPILSGAILIAVLLTAPRGFADLFERLIARVRKRLFKHHLPHLSDNVLPSKLVQASEGYRPQPRPTGLGMLSVRGISVRYDGLAALTDVHADFCPGVSGLVGPNGAGKTTLLNVITGLVRPTAGFVELNGRAISNLTTSQLARQGLIRSFQTVRLLDDETVLTNILLGRYRISSNGSFRQALGTPHLREREGEDHARAIEMARSLGLDKRDLNRKVSEIPFGGRRLVEIGRVLVSEPPVVLLDEPASGLTPLERHHLKGFLEGYVIKRPTIMLLTEHDVELIRSLCKHIVVLDSGQVITSGPPSEVFANAQVKKAYFGEGH